MLIICRTANLANQATKAAEASKQRRDIYTKISLKVSANEIVSIYEIVIFYIETSS
jgi:hypothetical protein